MTETASSVQALQASIETSIWAELADHSYDYDHPRIMQLNAQYDATIVTLLAMLGEDADVGMIDMGLATTYSNLYKDRVGFRPCGSTSYKDAKAFVESCKDGDISDDDILAEAELESCL